MLAHSGITIATRTTLLLRLKDWQDHESWQDFFDTYWKLIYGVARHSGLNDVEAQDVVQETFVSVAKHMPTFKYDRSIGSFKAWLLTMTRWRILDQLRKRAPQGAHHRPERARLTGTGTAERIVDPASLDLNKVWELEWENTLLEAAVEKVKHHVDPQKYQIVDLYVNKE